MWHIAAAARRMEPLGASGLWRRVTVLNASLGELIAVIYDTLYRYKTDRIYSALKMPPRQFAQLHAPGTMKSSV
jgi:hypothetical protein